MMPTEPTPTPPVYPTDQPDSAPTRKVTAYAVAVALSAIGLWAAQGFPVDEYPGEPIAVAAAGVIGALLAYFTRDRPNT